MNTTRGTTVLETLIGAINRGDLDAVVAQFADDVRSDTPAHPARSFVGREQIRKNWGQILGSIHNLQASILASASSENGSPAGETVWAEIAFDGNRPDGGAWQMRGVTVNHVVDGRIADLRFYLEPVEHAGPGADDAVRTAIGATPLGAAR